MVSTQLKHLLVKLSFHRNFWVWTIRNVWNHQLVNVVHLQNVGLRPCHERRWSQHSGNGRNLQCAESDLLTTWEILILMYLGKLLQSLNPIKAIENPFGRESCRILRGQQRSLWLLTNWDDPPPHLRTRKVFTSRRLFNPSGRNQAQSYGSHFFPLVLKKFHPVWGVEFPKQGKQGKPTKWGPRHQWYKWSYKWPITSLTGVKNISNPIDFQPFIGVP